MRKISRTLGRDDCTVDVSEKGAVIVRFTGDSNA